MKVLHPSNLVAPIRTIAGFSTRIFLGILIDEGGITRSCYIKAFLPGSRGLAGELAGWVLSDASGLRQPAAAWILFVEPRFLSSLWPDIDWGDDNVPCWASLQLDCPSPENLPTRSTRLLQRELRRWPALPLAIGMVEWLANGDANGGNLLRIAPAEFAMIDWAESFGGQYWQAAELDKIEWVYNKIAHLSGYIGNHLTIQPDDAAKVLHASARHQIALLASEPVLYEWLSDLIGSTEARAALDFLRRRAGLENTRWKIATKAG